MSLQVNSVPAVDFIFNNTPVQTGYLNGQLFWDRKFEIWVSSYTGGTGHYYGYFNIHDKVQAARPGFNGDVICHVDAWIHADNIDYPLDVGGAAPGWGYKSFTVRVEPNGAVLGYGGAGGKGAYRGDTTTTTGAPYYPTPGDGWRWPYDNTRNALDPRVGHYRYYSGQMGYNGGGCINMRNFGILQISSSWANHLLAGGGGGGGGAMTGAAEVVGGGGGGQGSYGGAGGTCLYNLTTVEIITKQLTKQHSNSNNGGMMYTYVYTATVTPYTYDRAGGSGNESTYGIGGRSYIPNTKENADNWPGSGKGGCSSDVGENLWDPSNGGNGGGWNQGGGGGGMASKHWTRWDNAHCYDGITGKYATLTTRGEGGGPGSQSVLGGGHDFRQPWCDGGWGGYSGQPVANLAIVQYY